MATESCNVIVPVSGVPWSPRAPWPSGLCAITLGTGKGPVGTGRKKRLKAEVAARIQAGGKGQN